LVKVDIAVANPTAGDFVSFLKISGTGFALKGYLRIFPKSRPMSRCASSNASL